MDGLKRNDVVLYRNTFFVIAESDLLPADLGIVTIPLLREYPRIPWLNPTIIFQDETLVLATRMIAALRRTSLSETSMTRVTKSPARSTF